MLQHRMGFFEVILWPLALMEHWLQHQALPSHLTAGSSSSATAARVPGTRHHECITPSVSSPPAFHTQYRQVKPFFFLQELSACKRLPTAVPTLPRVPVQGQDGT